MPCPSFRIALSSLCLLLLSGWLSLSAQAPAGIAFQSVARDASGIPLANANIALVFRIQTGGGLTVYEESHALTTDTYGLFKCVIGQGAVLGGSFAAIDWGASQHQVQILLNGVPMGTTALESVPYALYAEAVDMATGDLTDVDLTGLAPGQALVWNGTAWTPVTLAPSSIWIQNGTSAYYDLGGVGIGVDTPLATLHLQAEPVISGPWTIDTTTLLIGASLSGSGSKLLWYAQKSALRFGYLNNPFGGFNYDKFWDYDSVGFYSFAGGQNSRAKGFGAFAYGSFGWADGVSSAAFFGHASGNNSYTFGGYSRGRGSFTVEGTAEDEGGIAMYGYTGGRYGVAIGGGTTGLGASSSRADYAVAIGWNADARGQASIALGPSDAYGYNAFSTGWVTEARGNYSATFGYRTTAYPYGSLALGRYNVITGDSAAWVANDPVFIIGDGTTDATRSNAFVVLKNGRTAIGYDTPTGMLQVSTALGTITGTPVNTANAALLLGTPALGMAFDANQIEMLGDRFHLNYSSPENVSLVYGGGSVSIGQTVSPTDRLHIAALTGENPLRVQVQGVTRLRVHANGGVSVGANVLPPDAGLYVAGISRFDADVLPDNDGVYELGGPANRWQIVWATNGVIQTSDRRLKTHIRPLEAGLAKVMRLRPVTYQWRDQPEAGTQIGLIAQEVQAVLPELVTDPGPDAYLGVNYAELAPVLIQALQEQQAQLEAQAALLQAQQAEIDKLKAILAHNLNARP